jgi:hypothetical protein
MLTDLVGNLALVLRVIRPRIPGIQALPRPGTSEPVPRLQIRDILHIRIGHLLEEPVVTRLRDTNNPGNVPIRANHRSISPLRSMVHDKGVDQNTGTRGVEFIPGNLLNLPNNVHDGVIATRPHVTDHRDSAVIDSSPAKLLLVPLV